MEEGEEEEEERECRSPSSSSIYTLLMFAWPSVSLLNYSLIMLQRRFFHQVTNLILSFLSSNAERPSTLHPSGSICLTLLPLMISSHFVLSCLDFLQQNDKKMKMKRRCDKKG